MRGGIFGERPAECDCQLHLCTPPWGRDKGLLLDASEANVESEGGMSGFGIAGIVVGVGWMLLVPLLFYLQKRKKDQQSASSSPPSGSTTIDVELNADAPAPAPSSSNEEPGEAPGKKSVLLKLEELGLGQYASALIDEQGYDSMATLESLTKEEAGAIADEVKMKAGHKRSFVEGIASSSTGTKASESASAPSAPASVKEETVAAPVAVPVAVPVAPKNVPSDPTPPAGGGGVADVERKNPALRILKSLSGRIQQAVSSPPPDRRVESQQC